MSVLIAPVVEVVEYTDPGCIWSWSSDGTLRWLRRRYGDQLRWRRVFGDQIDDLARTHPGRDPVRDAEGFRSDWLAVADHTAAPVTARLEWMHRSSRPASAAALAAEAQGPAIAEAVLRRLRETVFVDGRPADTPERMASALVGVGELDVDQLLEDAAGTAVAAALAEHWTDTRRPHPDVVGRQMPGPNPGAAKADGQHLRYTFPTLVVSGASGTRVLSGWQAPQVFAQGFEEASGQQLVAREEWLEPEGALELHRSLTGIEIGLLSTGGPAPGAVRVPTATTPVWLHPEEAAARGYAVTTGTTR